MSLHAATKILCAPTERLLLNHTKMLGSLVSGGEEFNPGPEMRFDCSELLCNKVLLKEIEIAQSFCVIKFYKGDRESF